ncbi:MAG: hypothetical protein KDJ47_12295 [Hyphomicrobiaceae bacterium]|nr:hypothetical protein [Hyphomicrobiaceae bacterium]
MTTYVSLATQLNALLFAALGAGTNLDGPYNLFVEALSPAVQWSVIFFRFRLVAA